MGQQLENTWYDEVFAQGGSEQMYFLNYAETPWYPVWKQISLILSQNSINQVLDIGCGPGQFANCLLDEIPNIKYTGLDFSQTAINFANQLNPTASFIVADAVDYNYSSLEYDAVVITEFLEHVHGDLTVLEKLKSNSLILATLPNMDSEGHVRFLSKDYAEAIQQIQERYSDLCDIQHIQYFPYEENPENADYLITMRRK